MIDRTHDLPLTRQAEILKLSRSGLYYQPRPVLAADLATFARKSRSDYVLPRRCLGCFAPAFVMRRMDELHLDYPFAGSRMLRDLLRGEGVEIGRQHVATLM